MIFPRLLLGHPAATTSTGSCGRRSWRGSSPSRDDAMPHVGLYPFVYDGKTLDLHLVRSDEQIKDLKARPRCVLEVDEVLAVIPSYCAHPEYAGAATAYHRNRDLRMRGQGRGRPRGRRGPAQQRLLARYQPEGGFRPLDPNNPLYRGAMAQLAAVTLADQPLARGSSNWGKIAPSRRGGRSSPSCASEGARMTGAPRTRSSGRSTFAPNGSRRAQARRMTR